MLTQGQVHIFIDQMLIKFTKVNILRYFGPIVWDIMVPEKIKSLSTLEEFKREIAGWVPDNCPCRLCKDFIPGLGFVTLFE